MSMVSLPVSRTSAKAVNTLVAAAPDAIQLTVGQARLLQSLPGATQAISRAAHGCGECLRRETSARTLQPHD